MEAYQPIVFFDSVGAHIQEDTLNELPDLGLWYAIIPPRLTWLIQPLDTHVFQRFKFYLKTRFQDELSGSPDRVAIEYMVRLVIRAIRYVLQAHDWTYAFAQNGLTGDHNSVSAYIKKQMRVENLLPFETDAPTLDQLSILWPRNRVFPYAVVTKSLIDEAGYQADSEEDL